MNLLQNQNFIDIFDHIYQFQKQTFMIKQSLHQQYVYLCQNNKRRIQELKQKMNRESFKIKQISRQYSQLKQKYEKVLQTSRRSVLQNEELERQLQEKKAIIKQLKIKLTRKSLQVEQLQSQKSKVTDQLLEQEKKGKKKLNKLQIQNTDLKEELNSLIIKKQQIVQKDKMLSKRKSQLKERNRLLEKEIDQKKIIKNHQQSQLFTRILELENAMNMQELNLRKINEPVTIEKDNAKGRLKKIQEIQRMIKNQMQRQYQ